MKDKGANSDAEDEFLNLDVSVTFRRYLHLSVFLAFCPFFDVEYVPGGRNFDHNSFTRATLTKTHEIQPYPVGSVGFSVSGGGDDDFDAPFYQEPTRLQVQITN